MPRNFVKGLVSVVIPVYNAEKYIKFALDSVFIQNFPNLEVILIDDCSTDGSCSLINDLIADKPFAKYVKLEVNSGVAVARNKGLELASGQYIAFIDSDDIWESGKLNRQLKLFARYPKIPFTYTAIKYIDELGKELKNKRDVKEKITYPFLLRNTVVATSTVVIDRNVVGDIRFVNRRSAEDYSLWLTLLKHHGPAYGINEAFTSYRKSSTSVSSNRIGEVKYFYAVQTEDLHISKLKACFNTICYIFNAVKKHYL